MGEQQATVRFSEVGSQQVVGAFKNVGREAATSAQNVTQGTSAVKQFGSGIKSSAAGITQAATAFATLSLSIVGTYRAYRDLTDAQIQVNTAMKKQHSLELQVKTLKDQINKEQKVGTKGGIDYAIATNKITQAEQKLAADRKDHKHTAAELKGEELAITKARADLAKGSPKLAALEEKLKIAEEGLENQLLKVGEAHEHFNDVQQNFYLSLLPTGLSAFAALGTAAGGFKNILGGGGGLISMFGPLGLGLGALSLGVVAYQNNWLGLKDAVGGAITWIKDRLDLWRQGFADVFSFIQKGDWAGAFNRIKLGAEKFWADLVKSVPFFAGVAEFIGKIRAGDWGGAFGMIAKGAETAWALLKQKVPFFAGVETFIGQIRAGKWKEAFGTIASGAEAAMKQVLGALGGEKLILKFQLMQVTAVAQWNLLATTLTKKGGAFDLIKQGWNDITKGDISGGFGKIASGVSTAIATAKAALFSWVLTNFGVNLTDIEAKATAIGTQILNGIKGGLTFIARTWIDPFIANLFNAQTWVSALGAVWNTISGIGSAIFTFLAGAIGGAAADPKGAAQFWTDIGSAIWNGITSWMETNLPDTTAAIRQFGFGLLDAIKSTGRWFELGGMQIWNDLVNGFKNGLIDAAVNWNPYTSGLFKAFGIDAEKVKSDPNFKKMWTFDIDAKIKEFNAQDAIEAAKRKAAQEKLNIPIKVDPSGVAPGIDAAKKKVTSATAPQLPIGGDPSILNNILAKLHKTIGTTAPKMPISANTKPAISLAQQAKNEIDRMHATIKVTTVYSTKNIGGGGRKGYTPGYVGPKHFPKGYKTGQGGLHLNRLREDTMILAHKNEYVHVDKPERGGDGGGKGSGFARIRIELQDQLKDFIRAVVVEDMGTAR